MLNNHTCDVGGERVISRLVRDALFLVTLVKLLLDEVLKVRLNIFKVTARRSAWIRTCGHPLRHRGEDRGDMVKKGESHT